jgi:hypothetical protein
MPARRFPPPWSVEEQDACFVVVDHSGHTLRTFILRMSRVGDRRRKCLRGMRHRGSPDARHPLPCRLSRSQDGHHCRRRRSLPHRQDHFHPMFAQACSLEHVSQYSGNDIERRAFLQIALPLSARCCGRSKNQSCPHYSAARLLTKDEVRRIAANVKLVGDKSVYRSTQACIVLS